jgi:hypothetical protein
MPLLETILALQQRVILRQCYFRHQLKSQTQPIVYRAHFTVNPALRPWFYPQIHKQLAQLNPDLPDQIDPINLRRAAFHCLDFDGHFCHLLLEECSGRK